MKNKIVKHKIFGEGKVISLENNLLKVQFPVKESVFMFPDCFKDILITDDKELSDYAKLMLYNKELEESRKKSKINRTRININRGNALRWHSYKSSRPKINETAKYSRYKGENAFFWNSNEEMLNAGEITSESNIVNYVEKKDIILCQNNNFISHIGIVSEKSSNIIKCHFITILGEVKAREIKEDFALCTQENRDIILNEIKEVSPYMVSIEGIGHLMQEVK